MKMNVLWEHTTASLMKNVSTAKVLSGVILCVELGTSLMTKASVLILMSVNWQWIPVINLQKGNVISLIFYVSADNVKKKKGKDA
jgi:hypothetical protein